MDLPNEILIHIFEYSNVEDLKCITLASTKFYELVTTTLSINKKFKLKFRSKNDAIIIEALMDSGRCFENVCFPYHNENPICKSSWYINLMKKIGDRVKNIQFGKSGEEKAFICLKFIFKILETSPNIESLQIHNRVLAHCCDEFLASPIGMFNKLKDVHFYSREYLPLL